MDFRFMMRSITGFMRRGLLYGMIYGIGWLLTVSHDQRIRQAALIG
jgi:hypothetical protein